MNGIAHGPATAASGAIGTTYRGVARSAAVRAPIVVRAPASPAGVPMRATVASGGYRRASTARASPPAGPCRPASGTGSGRGPLTGPPRSWSGTISSGRDASIGVPTIRSVATTWIPAAGSRPHRSRASATSASSMAGLAGRRRRAGVVVDLRRSLLFRVPVGEAAVLEDLELLVGRCTGLLGENPDQVAAGARDRDDVGRRSDRRGEDCRVELRGELAGRDPAEVAAVAGLLALAGVLRGLLERRVVRDLGLEVLQPGILAVAL